MHLFECLNDKEFPVFVLYQKNVGAIGNCALSLGLVFQ